jgi:tRNA-Thr(GGU) m(6)t(6)A37 methyltransferase TsaA
MMTPTSETAVHPIGLLHSSFTEPAGTPIQGIYAPDSLGTAEIFPEFAAGLADLDGFSHLYLIYLFDRSSGYSLTVTPFRDSTPRGVFATRAPRRPNPLGLSIVRLIAREGNVLRLAEVDFLDGTPLLDIKPYVPAFDCRAECRSGWLERGDDRTIADGRFS